MRDDLHKSVPPRTAWAKVLRLVYARESDTELREAIVKAVRKDADWLGTSWGRQFESALDLGCNEMFAQEKVCAELKLLLATCPSTRARSTCEIALGYLAREGAVTADFKTSVLTLAWQAFAEDCIELVSSCVADRFGEGQAAQVRPRLRGLLPGCDLLIDPPRREASSRTSVESMLDQALPLSL